MIKRFEKYTDGIGTNNLQRYLLISFHPHKQPELLHGYLKVNYQKRLQLNIEPTTNGGSFARYFGMDAVRYLKTWFTDEEYKRIKDLFFSWVIRGEQDD